MYLCCDYGPAWQRNSHETLTLSVHHRNLNWYPPYSDAEMRQGHLLPATESRPSTTTRPSVAMGTATNTSATSNVRHLLPMGWAVSFMLREPDSALRQYMFVAVYEASVCSDPC